MIFSSIVGASLFATLADPEADIPAEKHVVAADWYAAVRRDIDQLLALSVKERGTLKNCFDRIRKEMSKVGQ